MPRLGSKPTQLLHTFSTFWLWSRVVPVLISVTTDMAPTGGLLVTWIFRWGDLDLSLLWRSHVLHISVANELLFCVWIIAWWIDWLIKSLQGSGWSAARRCRRRYASCDAFVVEPFFAKCKLTWLALGNNAFTCSCKVEQSTAFWGLWRLRCLRWSHP